MPEQPVVAEVTPEGVLLRLSATLPAELYTGDREAEFDLAEAELARVLDGGTGPRFAG